MLTNHSGARAPNGDPERPTKLDLMMSKIGGLQKVAKLEYSSPEISLFYKQMPVWQTLRIKSEDVISVDREPRRRSSLQALQEWEGYVTIIDRHSFTARMVDLTRGATRETHAATIPLDEVSDYDRSRLVEGAIFRWVIGYERTASGQKRRSSSIVFRRMPVWTRHELKAAAETAADLAASIDWY